MTKMPRDLWKRIVDSGFVAIVTVLSFLSFFVWRLLTSESDVKSHQKVQIGCFTSPSIRGISEKQSFLVYFQLCIISWKKTKKKRYWAYVVILNQTPPNLLGSCRSSSRWYLQNYIKNGWELTSELTSKWIYILKYSSKFHTNLINNLWSTRSNSTEFTGQWPQYHSMVPAKLHGRRLRIDVWIDV